MYPSNILVFSNLICFHSFFGRSCNGSLDSLQWFWYRSILIHCYRVWNRFLKGRGFNYAGKTCRDTCNRYGYVRPARGGVCKGIEKEDYCCCGPADSDWPCCLLATCELTDSLTLYSIVCQIKLSIWAASLMLLKNIPWNFSLFALQMSCMRRAMWSIESQFVLFSGFPEYLPGSLRSPSTILVWTTFIPGIPCCLYSFSRGLKIVISPVSC